MMRKFKRSELPAVRQALLKKQGYRCPISGRTLYDDSKSTVVDHDHNTGVVRAALGRGANGAEGKIANLLQRYCGGATVRDRVQMLRNLADYWELHMTPQTKLIYHLHKTPDEKRIAKNAKARKARAKKKDKPLV